LANPALKEEIAVGSQPARNNMIEMEQVIENSLVKVQGLNKKRLGAQQALLAAEQAVVEGWTQFEAEVEAKLANANEGVRQLLLEI
jgi:hypothetical protein